MVEARDASVPLSQGYRQPEEGKGPPPKWERRLKGRPAGTPEKIRRTVTYVERYHWLTGFFLSLHRYVAAMDVSHTSMAFLIVWAMRLRLEFLEEKEGTQQ